MATLTKFNCFVEDLAEEAHNLGGDSLCALLTNTLPNASDVQVDTDTATCTVESTSNAAEIAAGNGYTKKGMPLDITSSEQSSGTYKLVLADEVLTATGAVEPFQYVVLFNDSGKTSSTRPPIGWYDYGSSISLANGETFTIDFDQTNGVLTIA